MIYVGYSEKKSKYIIIDVYKSEKEVTKYLKTLPQIPEIYKIIDTETIEKFHPIKKYWDEFRGIFANKELFDMVKDYLELKDSVYSDILYHRVGNWDNSTVKNILSNGLIPQVGECYQSYLENYPDEIDELLLQKKYDNLFDSGNFVPAVFLCEDTDYEITDEDLLITIDKSLIENLYHDFNETRNDCFITTKRIPPKAILSIISIQYDENENEIQKIIYEK